MRDGAVEVVGVAAGDPNLVVEAAGEEDQLAQCGVTETLREDPGFAAGLNAIAGKVANRAVAEAQGLEFTSPAEVLGAPVPTAA